MVFSVLVTYLIGEYDSSNERRENGYHIVKQQANSRQRAFPRQKNLLDTDFCSGSDSLASSIKLDFSYIARTHGWMFQ